MISIEGNLSGMKSFNDVVQAYVLWTGKKSTAAKYTDALAAATSAGFYAYADTAAAHRKPELGHVYDWAKGNKLGRRLFKTVVRGQASQKQMFYTFLRSTKSVPRGEVPGDTRKTAHVFIWKAPVLESGAQTRPIKPKFGRVLAFPATDQNISSMGRSTKYTVKNGMIITAGPVRPHPSKGKGKFADLWMGYWTTVAEEVSISLVQKPTEYRLRTQIPNAIRKATRGAQSSRVFSETGNGWLDQEFDRTADQILNDAEALYMARLKDGE